MVRMALLYFSFQTLSHRDLIKMTSIIISEIISTLFIVSDSWNVKCK